MEQIKPKLQLLILLGVCLTISISCQSTPVETSPRSTPTLTRVPASLTPEPSFTATLAPATAAETATPSNAAMMTAVAQTPQPTLALPAPPNETGLIPGVTTRQQIIAMLGEPSFRSSVPSRGLINWAYGDAVIKNLAGVGLDGEILKEITLYTPNATAESIIAIHGPPEWVAYYPSPRIECFATYCGGPPIPPPYGDLLYLSKGLSVHFWCDAGKSFEACQVVQSCQGLPRWVPAKTKLYSVPVSIADWVKQSPYHDEQMCLRPWGGFSN